MTDDLASNPEYPSSLQFVKSWYELASYHAGSFRKIGEPGYEATVQLC